MSIERMKRVIDGLKRIQEFEAASFLEEYIDHLNECKAMPIDLTRAKRIGWRTADYTAETDSLDKARNWSANVAILPIFEGDPNTELSGGGQ